MAINDDVLRSVGAWTFLDAKVKEFEAACYLRNPNRLAEIEENCRSALAAVLDARRAVVDRIIRDADHT